MGIISSKPLIPRKIVSIATFTLEKKETRGDGLKHTESSFYLLDENMPDKRFIVDTNVGERKIHFPNGSYDIEYCCMSLPGFYPNEPDHINQDVFICEPALTTIKDDAQHDTSCAMFGVFDGHGSDGHLCSRYAKKLVPRRLLQHPEFRDRFLLAYNECFISTNESLHNNGSIIDSSSGTTAITGFFRGQTLYVANIGDSRAIGGKTNEKGELEMITLSIDQTPFRTDEANRVRAAGAEIQNVAQREGLLDPSLQDWGNEDDNDGDPPRLWIKGQRAPGTAFTRSIGDQLAESIGVFAVPEISTHTITDNDKYFIFCSDGVFEFLTSEQVLHLVDNDDIETACTKILKQAYWLTHDLWMKFDVRTDDITICALKINNKNLPNEIVRNDETFSMKNRPVRNKLNKEKERDQLVPLSDEEMAYSYPQEYTGDKKYPLSIRKAILAQVTFQDLDPNIVDLLINTVKVVNVDSGDLIIKQGEKGHFFFIVESGQLSAHIETEDGNSKKVHQYDGGDDIFPSFGEQAIMYNVVRSCNVIADSQCLLYVIPRTPFRVAVMRESQNPLDDQLKSLSGKFEEKVFSSGQLVVEVGSKLEHFYIIKRGKVEIKDEENLYELSKCDYFFGGFIAKELIDESHTVKTKCDVLRIPDERNPSDDGVSSMDDGFGQGQNRQRNIHHRCRPASSSYTRSSLTRTPHATQRALFKKALRRSKLRHATDKTFDTITYLYSIDESDYFLVTNKKSNKSLTMRRADKQMIVSAHDQQKIMRERDLLDSINYSGCNAIPYLLCTFQDPSHMFYIYNTNVLHPLQYLIEHKSLGIDSIIYLVSNLVVTLCRLHEKSIHFRGIDKSEIGFDSEGEIAIVNMKNSKISAGRTHTLCVPCYYMCPRMASGLSYDKSSDLWALGVLTYELVTGHNPFYLPDMSELDTYHLIISHEENLNLPDSGEECEAFINNLLQKDPTKRLGNTHSHCTPFLELSSHPFLKEIDWENTKKNLIKVPKSNPVHDDHYDGEQTWCENF